MNQNSIKLVMQEKYVENFYHKKQITFNTNKIAKKKKETN